MTRHVYPASRAPQRRLEPRVFLSTGEEVLLTLMCPKCRKMRPLSQFGLRRMGPRDGGKVRNCPWCKGCRSSRSRA